MKIKLDLFEWVGNDKHFCFAKGHTSYGSLLSSVLKSIFGTLLKSTTNLDEDRWPNLLCQNL